MKNKKNVLISSITLLVIVLAVASYRLVYPSNEIQRKPDHAQRQEDKEVHKEKKIDEHHDGTDDHEQKRIVVLDKTEMEEFDIEVATAGPGKIQVLIDLPGEITLNADRLVHVAPRVAGTASEVKKVLGDRVQKGEVMAVLESRELADMKADFLAARERLALTKANLIREERLWKDKISSEKEYLEAKNAFAEQKIEYRAAEQKLHALGFSEDFLEQLSDQPDISFTRYQIIAPFDGTVIEKHIVLGEMISEDTKVYVIADLSSVWVNINVYQKDIPLIRKGLPVVISAGHGIPEARGTISYIGPLIGEKARTALARSVLPNPDGYWRPGLFITAHIEANAVEAPLVVSKTAIQEIDNTTHIFIEEEHGFSPKPITIGQTDGIYAEVTRGISPGARYVSKGAFTLKAHLSKGAFGDGHAH